MKKITLILMSVLTVVILFGSLVSYNQGIKEIETNNLLRIHIRANSNDTVDQDIKYKIKDEFINFLTPLVADCETKIDAINIINENKSKLETIANSILKENGFGYKSNVKIQKEYFPTRVYENYSVKSGVYDAVIVELGDAVGNNWWCVIYPPLCFTNFSLNSKNIVYKSKIMEIINKFFS